MKITSIVFMFLMFCLFIIHRGYCAFNAELFRCKVDTNGGLSFWDNKVSDETLPYVLGRRPLPSGLSPEQQAWFDEVKSKTSQIRVINLYGNKLTELPKEIADFQALEEINLTYNKLTMLPPEITMLRNLQRLKLGSNPLREGVVDCIYALKNLKDLAIPIFENLKKHFSKLVDFCSSHGGSLCVEDNLEKISMDLIDFDLDKEAEARAAYLRVYPRIEEVKRLLNYLFSIEVHEHTLDFSECPFVDEDVYAYILGKRPLPDPIREYDKVCAWFDKIKRELDAGNVQRLILRGCCLDTLPATLFTLTTLEELDISNNSLRVLPNDFKKLEKLKSIELEGNDHLQVVPDVVKKLVMKKLVTSAEVTSAKETIDTYIKESNFSSLRDSLIKYMSCLSSKNFFERVTADTLLTVIATQYDFDLVKDGSETSFSSYLATSSEYEYKDEENSKLLRIFKARKEKKEEMSKHFLPLKKRSRYHSGAFRNVLMFINDHPDVMRLLTSSRDFEYLESIGYELVIALVQKFAPIIVSQQLFVRLLTVLKSDMGEEPPKETKAAEFYKFIKKIHLEDLHKQWVIYKTPKGLYYVLIPKDLAPKYASIRPEDFGFKDDLLTLIDFNLVTETPEVVARSQDLVSELKFFAEQSGLWNMYIGGHGYTERSVCGMPLVQFRNFLQYLAESLRVSFVFYKTCFGGGANLVTTFLHADGFLKLPFIIAQSATTEATTGGAVISFKKQEDISLPLIKGSARAETLFSDVNFKAFFDELCSVVRVVRLKETEFASLPGFMVDWGKVFYNITKKTDLNRNFPLIRYKGDVHFQPVLTVTDLRDKAKNKDKVVVMTSVKSKSQKEFVVHGDKTNVVLWYPPFMKGSLKIIGEKMPFIVSMNPEPSLHIFEKVEAQDVDLRSVLLGFVNVESAARRIFFIKKLVCKLGIAEFDGFGGGSSSTITLEHVVLSRNVIERGRILDPVNYVTADVITQFNGQWFQCGYYMNIETEAAADKFFKIIKFQKVESEDKVFGSVESLLRDYSKYKPLLQEPGYISPEGMHEDVFRPVALWQEKPAFMAAYALDAFAKQLTIPAEIKNKSEILKQVEDPKYEEFRERLEAEGIVAKFDPSKLKEAQERFEPKEPLQKLVPLPLTLPQQAIEGAV